MHIQNHPIVVYGKVTRVKLNKTPKYTPKYSPKYSPKYKNTNFLFLFLPSEMKNYDNSSKI